MKSNMESGESRVRAAPLWYEESAIDGTKVRASYMNADDVEVTEEEALAYVRRGRMNYPCGRVEQIHLLVDGDEVEISYRIEPLGHERIPRMIGGAEGFGCSENASCPKAKSGAKHA